MAISREHRKKTWHTFKKHSLLDAVVKVFSREGTEGLTMENVALEAGVAKGTLYSYFKSKNELLHAMIEGIVEPLVESLKQVLASDLPADEKIREFTFRHLSYFEDNRSFFQVLVYDRTAAQERLRRYKSCRYQTLLENIAVVIDQGVKKGIFRSTDSLKAAAIMIEANIGVINQRLLNENSVPVEEDVKLLTDLFLFGIAEEKLRKRKAS